MKGIVLPGPSATNLYPITNLVIKHLLPIYTTPILYEPSSGLMMAGEGRMDS